MNNSAPIAVQPVRRQIAIAAVGTRLDRDDAAENFVTVWQEAEGQGGVCIRGEFFSSHLSTLHLRLIPGRASRFRIEAHGQVTRMQKAVATIAADGTVLSRAEEVADIAVACDGHGLEVTFSFVPYRSAIEWFYVFAENIEPGNGPLFRIEDVRHETLANPELMPSRPHGAVRDVDGVLAACHNMIILRSCLHLHLEIHKPGASLVGLALDTPRELAHLRWWTWLTDPVDPGPGELVAHRPSYPVPSPALMDALGPGHANDGHLLSGVYADWLDFDRMDLSASDALRDITVRARFSDGSRTALRLLDLMDTLPADNPATFLLDRHLEQLRTRLPKQGTVLEVGARGPLSTAMRDYFTPQWHYVGLDHGAGENVDIVGDAHRMSELLAHGSMDVVYSSVVMEHLLSPMRFVLEANRVLANGGLFIARMPTTWPLHAEPWDYWRISKHGWRSLLNRNTGFEILDTCEIGFGVTVPALPSLSGSTRMHMSPAPLETMVVARKIAEAPADTSGWSADLAVGSYDHA